MDVVVVTWDSLAPGALGCYGNEWVETPTFDRLAAEGVVLDRCVAGADCAWRDSVRPVCGVGDEKTCLPKPGKHGTQEVSLHSAQAVSLEDSTHPTAGFEVVAEAGTALAGVAVETVTGRSGLGVKPAEVPAARLMEAGVRRVRGPSAERPLRLWLHGAGVDVPCEPPEGFATLYVDECDERGIPAPDLESPEWREHPAVYAGAVSLLDHWLGTLVAALEARGRPVLVIVAGLRGAAWRTLAKRAGPAELQRVQAPVVICPLGNVPGWSEYAGERIRRPVSLAGLTGTIAEACGEAGATSWLSLLAEPHGFGEVLFGTESGGAGLWSSEWLALQPGGEPAPAVQLFVQADDHFAVNDVAGSNPVVAEGFEARLREWAKTRG